MHTKKKSQSQVITGHSDRICKMLKNHLTQYIVNYIWLAVKNNNELCQILKSFEEATLEVQKEKSVGASIVVPLCISLKTQNKLRQIHTIKEW